MSKPEFEFDVVRELLRRRFKVVFEEQNLGVDGRKRLQLEVLKHFHKVVVDEVNLRISKGENRAELEKDYMSPIFIEYILKGEKVSIDNEASNNPFHTQCLSSKYLYLTQFVNGDSSPRENTCEFFSICCGYKGLNHFIRKNEKSLLRLQDEYSKQGFFPDNNDAKEVSTRIITSKNNPLENSQIANFFSKPSYVFVYNEDLAPLGKETDLKSYHYPSIHALILRYDQSAGYFNLENVEGKSDHSLGEITWCNENDETCDYNAFDIRFRNSRTKLILRFSLPYKRYEEIKNFDLVLGTFLAAFKAGNVVAGSVIMQKHLEALPIQPYTYDYKDGEFAKIVPPIEIRRYLFDRYLNWNKVPYNITSFDLFDEWLNEKYTQDYTKRKITVNEFLVCYPDSSFKNRKASRDKLISSMDEVLYSPELVKEKWTRFSSKEQDLMCAFLKENFSKENMKDSRRLVFYPPREKMYEPYTGINQDILFDVQQSINLIFIIPDDEYSSVSSINTMIGYAMALRKRVMIFYQNKEHLPNILKETDVYMHLYVMEYKDVSDIPVKLARNCFRKEWKKIIKESDSAKK